MLACLTIFGDTSFEFTGTGSNDEDSAVGLGGTCDHVLDEVTVAGGICIESAMSCAHGGKKRVAHTDDGDVVFGGLELP